MIETSVTVSTPPANRKEFAEAFGQNQTTVRRLEAMTRDLTVNIPNALDDALVLAAALLAMEGREASDGSAALAAVNELRAVVLALRNLPDVSARTAIDEMRTLVLASCRDSDGAALSRRLADLESVVMERRDANLAEVLLRLATLETLLMLQRSSRMEPSNNLAEIPSPATARSNLGLGAANSPTFSSLTLTGGFSFAPTTTTAAPAAGVAGALPATPSGYATVTIDGISRQIAYY
jgi:hypothetical protein